MPQFGLKRVFHIYFLALVIIPALGLLLAINRETQDFYGYIDDTMVNESHFMSLVRSKYKVTSKGEVAGVSIVSEEEFATKEADSDPSIFSYSNLAPSELDNLKIKIASLEQTVASLPKSEKGEKGDSGITTINYAQVPTSQYIYADILNRFGSNQETTNLTSLSGMNISGEQLVVKKADISETINLGGTLTVTATSTFSGPLTASNGLTISGGTFSAGTTNLSTTTLTGAFGVQDLETNSRFYVNPSGYVGIGTMDSTSTLTVLGTDSSPILGSNIISNGTFDTDLSGWTATGWNWFSGKAQHTAGNTNKLSQSVSVEADEFYLLQFTLSNVIDWQSWIYMYVGGDREYCTGDFCGHSFRATSTGLVDISIITMSSAGVSMIDDVVFQKITNPSLPVMRIWENNGNEGIEIRSGEAASKNMFIGFQAGGNTKYIGNYSNNGGYNNTGIGYQSLYTNITGGSNTAMGAKALFSNINGGSNVAIGGLALYSNTSGNTNIAIGSSALYSNTIGLENIAIGDLTLYKNTEGYTNIAIGREALENNTTGSNNLALGYGASIENITGSSNTSIGYQTNYYNTAGNENVAVGYDALLYAEEGSWNTAIGTEALANTSPAAFANTALGYGAGRGNNNNYSNSSSTWVGYQSGYNIRTGSKNITLGYKTADSLTTGSGNIVIGYDIDTPAANSDNTLTIGNIIFANGLGNTGATVATGTVGVGIAAPTAKLHISRSTGGIEKLFQVGTTTTADIFSVNSNGRVGVGTSTPWEAMELAVAGDIVVTGNVYKSATAYANPDYVFAKYFNNPYNEIIPDDYQMLSLDDLGLYIQEYNHLPGVEMKSGMVDIFEANRLNLEKIEELSLYILEVNNRIKVFKEQGGGRRN